METYERKLEYNPIIKTFKWAWVEIEGKECVKQDGNKVRIKIRKRRIRLAKGDKVSFVFEGETIYGIVHDCSRGGFAKIAVSSEYKICYTTGPNYFCLPKELLTKIP